LPDTEIIYSWLHTNTLDINFPIEISTITLTAEAVVNGINLISQIYAVGYLEMDWGWARFFSLMNCFCAGICGLVLTNSLFFRMARCWVLSRINIFPAAKADPDLAQSNQ
jgi:NAD(P)H-quinone oxidoreductase subunit 5